MNNRDRDSVARLLEQVAQRLEDAPRYTAESAANYSGSPLFNVSAFQAGALEQICKNESASIRLFVKTYLSAPPPRPRGRK